MLLVGFFGFLNPMGTGPFVLDEAENEVSGVRDSQRGIVVEGWWNYGMIGYKAWQRRREKTRSIAIQLN